MKLYRYMHDLETKFRKKGRQLLFVQFLNYLPLTKFNIVNRVRDIFMKIYRCMHDIETMCCEKETQLLLVWFLSYLPLTKFHTVNRAITPELYAVYL